MSAPRFFFYGTLLSGSGNPVARVAHRKLLPGRPATAPGALHAIRDAAGWYPALTPGEGEVRGMVHEAARGFGTADLARLDAYEECGPGGEYQRREIAVRSGGQEVLAQAYVYVAALPEGALPVPDGDFAAFLQRGGLSGYRPPD